MEAGAVWLAILLAVAVIMPILHAVAGKEARIRSPVLQPDEFSPIWLLPAALVMESFLPRRLRSLEAERLMPRIILIHGTREAAFHLQIHLAVKCLGFWLGMMVSAFLGMAGEIEPVWILAVPAGGVLLYLLSDRQLENRYRERTRQLERAFPGFVSKLALLVGAGMHVRQAIIRIVREQGGDNALHRELAVVLEDIEGGMTEQQAYGELAERCRIREIANFTGILLQHVRLGGSQMLFELRRMSSESWDIRKNNARRQGEEASSKLVFPLAVMFIAVIIVSIAPAFLSISAMK
jgi:tight adherence protein C